MSTAYAVNPLSTDVNLFSASYKAQQENSKKYYQDAVIDFTKKLNIAIKKHNDLKSLSQSCGGCDVILPTFDDYLKTHLPRKDYGIVIASFFNSSVSKNISSQTQKRLNDLIAGMLTTIIEDTDYLIQMDQDILAFGEYSDLSTNNSPYDLMDDMQKVSKLLFKDPPQYEGYVNTMKNDAAGLITDRFEVGQWAQGKKYEIDLSRDVASAFWQGSDGSSGGDAGSGQDCESGFCITTDIIYNDQYTANGNGRNFVNGSFEEIFSSANGWLINRGDKRNLACKWPPPVNHFQSNNTDNLSFKNIFRGLGIFVFEKTPRFAQQKTWKPTEKTLQQKEKDTDAVIASSFKNRNINPDNLMLYTQEEMVARATPLTERAADSAANQERAARLLKERQAAQNMFIQESRYDRGNIDESTKNMFRIYASWMQSFGTMVKDILDITKAWKDKPDCKN